jgi:hypothetical protein
MSLMPFRRALLSAMTLFGGHFLNRRLDRVVLVGTLLALVAIGLVGVPFALSGIDEASFMSVTWAQRLLLIFVAAVSLLSAGLTFRDARRPPGGPLTTTIRVTRLPLSLFGVLVVAAAVAIAGLRSTPGAQIQTESVLPPVGRLYFGSGGVASIVEFQPPRGPERLRGRITLDGAGIEGVRLALTLNGEYKVEGLETGSRGVFEVPLPAGKWHINDIVVSDWDSRPKHRDLILFSGREPMKDAGLYSRFNYHMAGGLEVSLPAESNTIPIEIEFRDALPMTWPLRPNPSGYGPERDSEPDDEFSSAAIAWEPVKGASEYEVQIGQVKREGTMTYSLPMLTRRLSGVTLPLASLPQRSASALKDEYAVQVFAFDAEGRLLTESSMKSDGGIGVKLADRLFQLTGATRLGREQQYVGFSGRPQVISAEYEINDVRLELAAKLLDQKRLNDARRVLDLVTKDAAPGRASALRARLAALEGDCVTAMRLFDKAESEAGCVPIEDRKLCEAPERREHASRE